MGIKTKSERKVDMEAGMRERSEQLRETLCLWDAFIKDAPLSAQINTQCRILINLWRAELESIDAVAKCRGDKPESVLCGVFDNLSTMRRERYEEGKLVSFLACDDKMSRNPHFLWGSFRDVPNFS
jgi:hypothetical protein